MKVWIVDCEDLSCVWSSYEKAKEYILNEAERCEWELDSYDYDDEEAKEQGCNLFQFTVLPIYPYRDRGYQEAVLWEYEVDTKPYVD